MEKELEKYIIKKIGQFENYEVISDNGRTIIVFLDLGDDEELTVTINRRKGDNGNYRISGM